ncbi:Tar ligand binding domain-containing protein [Sphingomonas sp. R-74633]|uniref:methyl-accepting chemotaxis protein n=1 Tax=Sphingomonas sp. R-74633 TaxID=2751188 RepID=UPI0015D44F72|nr:methyl-accepting chemotaxis protein [Sphingomonas sp. R-74633]NYT39781.1 Tar ligand binding domain-containing protein [Sphingomonas sp. R-74633]
MTLKQKLLAALVMLGIVLGAVIAGFSWSATTSRNALDTVLADRVIPLKDLKLVADSYAVNIVDSAQKARTGNLSFDQAAANIQKGKADLDAAWKRYAASDATEEEEALAKQAEAAMAKANDGVARLEKILRAGDRAGLDQFIAGEIYADVDPVSDTVGKLVNMQISVASEVTTNALGWANVATAIVIALGLIALGVLGGAFYIVSRKVVAPIKGLAEVIHGLARQNGGAKVPHLDQRDEIGDIARSVDAFLEAVIAKERDAAAAAAKTQKIVTTALADGLSALADGDLTGEIRVEFPESYATLKTNFNSALTALRTLIAAVSEGAIAIQSGSTEIAQASEDLARRTEASAASIEETSAALAQMDERLRGSAESASQTVRSADEAIRVVGDGRTLAEQAVTAMGRVSDSARGIDDVIEGLDKIAFQTRVLAMNAAVEAGRAGEAGRGFAVVADLVSALAMRAEEEAKRAREQLTVTQDEVGSAVDAVQRMDTALEAISGGVGAVHKLLDAMAADNQAQSTAITQIVTAVSEMDRGTQQNAAMVEETSAASRNLAVEVANLADQSSRFRTGPATSATPRSRSTAQLHSVAA